MFPLRWGDTLQGGGGVPFLLSFKSKCSVYLLHKCHLSIIRCMLLLSLYPLHQARTQDFSQGGQDFARSAKKKILPPPGIVLFKKSMNTIKYTKKTTFLGVTNLIESKVYSFARETNFNFLTL